MSAEILHRLRLATAFKPKPPDYELAVAHVPVSEVGIPHAIDARVAQAMRTEDEAFVVIIGPPGSGKSSLLTAAAAAAAVDGDAALHPLALKVPIAHHVEPITADLLVRAVAQSLGSALAASLTEGDRRRLERSLATTIASAHQSRGLSGSLSAGPPWLRAEIAADLGRDLVTLTSRSDWRGGGPLNTLLALRDLAASHHTRLAMIFDDTDVWSVGDEQMAVRARAFFSALRVLLDCPEISTLVAVQTRWTVIDESAAAPVAAAVEEYLQLSERVGARLRIPLPESSAQSRGLMAAILDRRVRIVLPDEPVPAHGWADALFTPAALDLLGNRALTKSIRVAIADVRDAFDHLDEMPDRISREHLVEVIDS